MGFYWVKFYIITVFLEMIISANGQANGRIRAARG